MKRDSRRIQSDPRRRGLAGAALVSVVVGGLFVTACQEVPEAETVLRPVRYEVVAPSGEARLRTFAGVAKAGLESDLSFRVAGTVEEVPVVVGQRVQRGQILARIDITDYELKVQEALAGLAQAEAASRNAEADYERVRGLYESNNVSRRELDGARANSESSQAQVDAAQKRLEQARRQLSYGTLRAPVDGLVASSDVDVNENVQAGQRLFLLTAGGEIEVEVALPEAVIVGVEIGQPVQVIFDAVPGRHFAAEVTEAGGAAVGTATTFPVTVRLTEPNPGVRSGMAAEVGFRFEAEAGGDRLVVPAVSVGEDREGRFVYVLEEVRDGRGAVRRIPVTTGELSAGGIEVLTGLSGGEHVVTAGVRRLTNGELVLVQEGA